MPNELSAADLQSAVGELAKMQPVLSTALRQFARNFQTAANRRGLGSTRGRPNLSRLPRPPAGRIAYHMTAMPRPLRTSLPPTAIQRRPGGRALPPTVAAQVQDVQKEAATIRGKLQNFHNGLQILETDLRLGTTVLQAEFGNPQAQGLLHNLEEKIFAGVAVILAIGIAIGALGVKVRENRLPVDMSSLEQKVASIAGAIAVAEGYYAPGSHNGHSLPHSLNNPGSLKKPALGAEQLPTWKDTGLVVFPSEEAGWAALRHQVNLMLRGQSSVYSLSDTLETIADKYADGDANWGKNVAKQLQIPTSTKLAEIAAQPNPTPRSPPPVQAHSVAAASLAGQ